MAAHHHQGNASFPKTTYYMVRDVPPGSPTHGEVCLKDGKLFKWISRDVMSHAIAKAVWD